MKKKEVVLAAIFTSVGLLSWLSLFVIFYGGQKHLNTAIISVAFFLFFGALYSLLSFLAKTKKIIIPSIAIVSFVPLFIFGWNIYMFCGLLIFFGCLSFGLWMTRTEKEVFSLRIRPLLILRKNMGIFFLATSLVISLVFYLSPSSVFKLEIPRPLFDGILKEFAPIIAMQFPGINMEMTVDEFFMAQLLFYETQPQYAIESGGNVIDLFQNSAFAEISKLTKSSNLKYLNNLLSRNKFILEENKKSFYNVFGNQASGNEKIKDVIYRFVNSKLLALSKPYQNYISLGFVFVVFLALQTLTLPFNLIAGFLAWVLFKLLLAVKFVRIEKQMVEREIISI